MRNLGKVNPEEKKGIVSEISIERFIKGGYVWYPSQNKDGFYNFLNYLKKWVYVESMKDLDIKDITFLYCVNGVLYFSNSRTVDDTTLLYSHVVENIIISYTGLRYATFFLSNPKVNRPMISRRVTGLANDLQIGFDESYGQSTVVLRGWDETNMGEEDIVLELFLKDGIESNWLLKTEMWLFPEPAVHMTIDQIMREHEITIGKQIFVVDRK